MDDDVRLSFKSCYLSGVHTTSILRQFNLHELKEMLFPSKIDRFYYGNRMLSTKLWQQMEGKDGAKQDRYRFYGA